MSKLPLKQPLRTPLKKLLLGAVCLCLWFPVAVLADRPFTEAVVMTQNQYLGADLTPIIGAQSPAAYNQAVLDALESMANNRFAERAGALARSIVMQDAHLVALQEVFSFHCVESGSLPGACSLFNDAMVDHLDLTLDALSAQGAHYEVAAVVENLTIPDSGFQVPGLPVYLDEADDIPEAFIQVLDRDVILARQDVVTSVVNLPCAKPSADGCNFDTIGSASTLAGIIDIERGFVAVDAEIQGRSWRFVNTHLEVRQPSPDPNAPLIQAAQATQMIATLAAVPAPEGTVTLIVGDINSSPEDPMLSTGFGTAWPPYEQIALGVSLWGQPVAQPYEDLWDAWWRYRPGFTCCQAADLSNRSSELDARIDVIFASERPDFPITYTVNSRQFSKTASGLWPSDHAGVVARLINQ